MDKVCRDKALANLQTLHSRTDETDTKPQNISQTDYLCMMEFELWEWDPLLERDLFILRNDVDLEPPGPVNQKQSQ